MSKQGIRPVRREDLTHLKGVIDAVELFPSELLDEMFANSIDAGRSTEHWLTFERDVPVGLAYYAPERMTEGTWNLHLIAVHPAHQGQGIGAALMSHVENSLASQGERILIVETSGLDEFDRTRNFYRKSGYEEEARIRDFYQAGEDKVIFWKKLTH